MANTGHTASLRQAPDKTNYFHYWFINLLGNFGIQLKPKRWTEWTSIVNIVANIIVFSIAVCGSSYINSFFVTEESGLANEKGQATTPLVKLFYMGLSYYPMFTMAFSFVHLYCYGQPISQLMGERTFSLVYQNISPSLVVCWPAFVLLLYWQIVYCVHLKSIFDADFLIFFLVATYFTIIFIFALFIAHYFKYGTYKRIREIRENVVKMKEKAILEEIRTLAECNRQIHDLLSWLLIIFFFCYTLDTMLTFFAFAGSDVVIYGLFYDACVWLYLCYIIYLDRQIQIELAAIFDSIIQQKDLIRKSDQLNLSILTRLRFYCETFRIKAMFEIYAHDLRWNIFGLCTLDCQFILDYFLFSLAYIVLTIQTSNYS